MSPRLLLLVTALAAACRTQRQACFESIDVAEACRAIAEAAGLEGPQVPYGDACEDFEGQGPFVPFYRCRIAAFDGVDCSDQAAIDRATDAATACELFPRER